VIAPDLLTSFRHLILGVEEIQHHNRRGIEVFKARLNLADGTNLRISEVRVDGQIKKYSYYWLDEHNKLLIGWDNTPHHQQIDSFPNHRHRSEKVEESQEKDLEAVLNYIAEIVTRGNKST
jgi:hypothetical protein